MINPKEKRTLQTDIEEFNTAVDSMPSHAIDANLLKEAAQSILTGSLDSASNMQQVSLHLLHLCKRRLEQIAIDPNLDRLHKDVAKDGIYDVLYRIRLANEGVGFTQKGQHPRLKKFIKQDIRLIREYRDQVADLYANRPPELNVSPASDPVHTTTNIMLGLSALASAMLIASAAALTVALSATPLGWIIGSAILAVAAIIAVTIVVDAIVTYASNSNYTLSLAKNVGQTISAALSKTHDWLTQNPIYDTAIAEAAASTLDQMQIDLEKSMAQTVTSPVPSSAIPTPSASSAKQFGDHDLWAEKTQSSSSHNATQASPLHQHSLVNKKTNQASSSHLTQSTESQEERYKKLLKTRDQAEQALDNKSKHRPGGI